MFPIYSLRSLHVKQQEKYFGNPLAQWRSRCIFSVSWEFLYAVFLNLPCLEFLQEHVMRAVVTVPGIGRSLFKSAVFVLSIIITYQKFYS